MNAATTTSKVEYLSFNIKKPAKFLNPGRFHFFISNLISIVRNLSLLVLKLEHLRESRHCI